MDKKITIAADETIVCPSCNHQFSLDQGITRHTIERYESDYAQSVAAQRKELEASVSREAERRVSKLFTDQVAKLNEDLADVRKAEQQALAQVEKVQIEVRARAVADFALEKKALADADIRGQRVEDRGGIVGAVFGVAHSEC